MFLSHHYLLLLIAIVLTCPVDGDVCSDDKVYSDIRMMESSRTPHWEVLNQYAGLVQLYYYVTKQPNENSTLLLKGGESWTLELYHLFHMDNQALAYATIQNCSTNYMLHENPYANGTAYRYWCKLQASQNVIVTINSNHCSECSIHGKLHSKVPYKMGGLNSSMDVKWLFNYVYPGWYALLSNNIVSAPVWLETKYTKKVITNLNVVFKLINYTTVETRIIGEPLKNDCYNPLLNTSCVEIEIYYQKFKIYYNNKAGEPKYCYNKRNVNETSVTNIHWNTDDLTLDFRLNGLVTDENILLLVRVFDTRCRRGVWGWESKRGNTCVWSKPFYVNAYNKASHVDLPPATSTARTQVFVVLIVAIATLVALIVLILSYLGYTRLQSRRNPSSRSIELPPKVLRQPPSSIFLLYARDCHVFMETMERFRELLQLTTQKTVYDLWDEKVREELYALGETWILNHLMRESTRVIVVATPVSRRIERFILDNQWPSNEFIYHEPNSLDEIYVSSFKTSIRMTFTLPDSETCRKFIVCRMGTMDCKENLLKSFEKLCTIYTLPSLLDSLFVNLFDDQWEPQQLAVAVREPFESKIEELEEYVKHNPSYHDKMLRNVHDETERNTI